MPLAAPRVLTDADRVYRWRRDEFERMGFTAGEAADLASSTADLHRVELQLRRGCTHKQALDIFL